MSIASPSSPIETLQELKLKSKFCGGKFIHVDHLKPLVKKPPNEKSIRDYIASIFFNDLENFNEELQTIFLDYMFYNWEFSLMYDYSLEKTSSFLEISHKIFMESFNNRLPYEKSFDLFRDVIVQHSLFRPPHSILVFNLEEIKNITDLFLSTFYKHYTLYLLAYTPIVHKEIVTFEMFKTRFPICLDLDPMTTKAINKTEQPALREYLIDKETGLTKEELEEIMKGDSIHHVPMKKREEWMRLKAEREQKEKIDRVMKKEIENLYHKLEQGIKVQDEEFLNRVNDFKTGKKK